MNLNHLTRTLGNVSKKHAPTILTALGVIGVGATSYLSARAGYRSAEEIIRREVLGDHLLDAKEKVQVTWKNYIPPVSTGFATLAFLISSNVISVKRQAALIGAYALSERFLNVYKDKMIEVMGVDAEQQARAEIIRDQAQVTSTEKFGEIPVDKSIFLDSLSGQYFLSDLEIIRKAMNDTNQKVIQEGYASMNYFYSLIGARRTQIGEVIGWNSDRLMDIVITHGLKTEDGEPCTGLDYNEMPTMEYHRVW